MGFFRKDIVAVNGFNQNFAGWGREFSGTLNEMLWGAETTFGDILKSFGKMITQMMIQKSIIEPMFSGGSSGKGLLGGLLSAGIGALGVDLQVPALLLLRHSKEFRMLQHYGEMVGIPWWHFWILKRNCKQTYSF